MGNHIENKYIRIQYLNTHSPDYLMVYMVKLISDVSVARRGY